MADYATLADLKAHWPDFDADNTAEAEQKLVEAQVEVLTLYPDIPRRVDAGVLSADAVKLVVCRMVKRAMESPVPGAEGLTSLTESEGPFSSTLQFRGGDGALYVTKADRRLLSAGRENGQAFSIYPSRL